jgi:DMSO/TMAO reductase YedYZ molybdopterin-dependent catalytic subunit
MEAMDEHTVPHASRPGTVQLIGRFERPSMLTLDALKAFPSVRCNPFELRCFTTKRFLRAVDAYRGVLLTDLMTSAGLQSVEQGDFKRMIFVAEAHDGYAVTFSWHELFNTPVGAQAMIAYECGETPLSVEDGLPILFSGADIAPAARHMKRVARIEALLISR